MWDLSIRYWKGTNLSKLCILCARCNYFVAADKYFVQTFHLFCGYKWVFHWNKLVLCAFYIYSLSSVVSWALQHESWTRGENCACWRITEQVLLLFKLLHNKVLLLWNDGMNKIKDCRSQAKTQVIALKLEKKLWLEALHFDMHAYVNVKCTCCMW